MLPYPLSHIAMAPPPQELWIDDLADILALHETVHAAQIEAEIARGGAGKADHGLFARETRDFFREHLADRGRIYGVRSRNRLIAYGVLGLPDGGTYNFGAWAGLPASEWHRVAHADGVAVHPDYRGQKLQLVMLKHRLLAAQDHRRDLIYSTAAPDNLHSLGNLLLAGFVIVARRKLFGGHDRFILAWADHRAAETAQRHAVELEDAEAQERLLSEGFVGILDDAERGGLCFVAMNAFTAPWSGIAPPSKT